MWNCQKGHANLRTSASSKNVILPSSEHFWHIVLLSYHEGVPLLVAGFKSRTRFTDIEDIFKVCVYVSEIIDQGLDARPLFQVTVYTFVASEPSFSSLGIDLDFSCSRRLLMCTGYFYQFCRVLGS